MHVRVGIAEWRREIKFESLIAAKKKFCKVRIPTEEGNLRKRL